MSEQVLKRVARLRALRRRSPVPVRSAPYRSVFSKRISDRRPGRETAFSLGFLVSGLRRARGVSASAFHILDGSIQFGDKPCQVCCGQRTGFAQAFKNAYPFGTRRRANIWESGA
jgi:hypothetical protein